MLIFVCVSMFKHSGGRAEHSYFDTWSCAWANFKFKSKNEGTCRSYECCYSGCHLKRYVEQHLLKVVFLSRTPASATIMFWCFVCFLKNPVEKKHSKSYNLDISEKANVWKPTSNQRSTCKAVTHSPIGSKACSPQAPTHVALRL